MTGGPRPRIGAMWRALGASLALHALVVTLVSAVIAAGLLPAPLSIARDRRAKNDEVVTISSAIRFDKRARPVPPARATRTRAPAPIEETRSGRTARRSAQSRPASEIADDPLVSASRESATSPKRYRLQIDGTDADLRHGEGHYVPIKAWHAHGSNYYYVSYAFTYANGNFERGIVPWAVSFDPRDDPFLHPGLARLRRTPLPGPPPSYVPPGTLPRALRAFFPHLRFDQG